MQPNLLQRRNVAAALVLAPVAWRSVRAQNAAQRIATPSQTDGPFYPVVLPQDSDYDLLRNGTRNYSRGQAAWVEGSVSDLAGKPIAGAQVEIWQCDEGGHYHHPADGGRADPAFQGFGRVGVDSAGAYRFRTIRPVPYSGRTPHIHVKVRLGTRELLTTQLYVAGDPGNDGDFLWRRLSAADRAALTVPFAEDGPGAAQARFNIVVAA